MGALLSAFVVVFIALSGLPLVDGHIDEGTYLELVFSISEPVITEQDGLSKIAIDGWNTVGSTGSPLLPERTFQVPLGPYHAEYVSATEIGPWNAMTIGRIATGSPVSNGIVTVMNDIRKGPFVESFGMLETKNANFISLRLSPYDYKDGVLRYPTEVRVTLELDADVPTTSVQVPNDLPDAQEHSGHSAPIWETPARSPGDIGSSPSYSNTIPPTEMVIVTTSTYNSSLKDLAIWKTRKGIYTRIVEVGWITGKYSGADTPEKIRKYLIDLYTKENLKWVVLAGDHDTVPSRMAYIPDGYDDGGSDGSTVPADSYYSDLTGSGATPYDWDGDNDGNYGEYSVDGIDLNAEVYVGRLSASSTTQMSNLVKNILDYEKSPPSGGWTNRSVVAGAYSNYKTSSTTNDTTDEADLKEAIRSDFLNNGKYNVYKLYEKAGIWPSQQTANMSLTNSNMVSAIDPGAFMVNMAGHGSSTGIYRRIWNTDSNGNKVCDGGETSDTAYYSTSATQTNGGKKPLFYNDACNNGEFDRTSCLTEDILNDVGIGAVGSARVSWYEVHWTKGTNGGYYNQGHDYRFWQQFFNGGNHQPGRSLALSKPDYISDVGSYMDLYAWKNLLQYNLMGDPEIPIWTQSPKTLTVTYANPIPSPGQVSITVKDQSSNAVAGARVCLMNGTIFYGYATTDAAGVAKITLPTITKSMNLTVTKNDFKVWTKAVSVGEDETPPTISSVSFVGQSTTGDAFQVRAYASDDGGISMACLHHAYSASQPTSFTNSTMTFGSGYYVHSNTHPQGSTLPLWYRFGAWDSRGNMNLTAWTSVQINDNDRPIFSTDGTDPQATTGDVFSFSIQATDNIGVTSIRVNYTMDEGAMYQNLTMVGSNPYQASIVIPTFMIGMLRYRFLAYDAANNVEQTIATTRTIVDNDDPYMDKDHTAATPTTGDPFTLSMKALDNLGVVEVRASYKIGAAPLQNRSMASDGANYTLSIAIPDDEIGVLTYRYMLKDTSGNIHWTDEIPLQVLDDDLPGEFEDHTAAEPTTGDPVIVRFDVIDNIAIGSAFVDYSIMDGLDVVTAQFNASNGYYEARIDIPSWATGNLSFRFRANDPSGNSNASEWMVRGILDDDAPSLGSLSMPTNGTTGEDIDLSFSLSDNIGITKAMVDWTIDNDGGFIDLDGPIGEVMGTFHTSMNITNNDGDLGIVLIVQDEAGNELREFLELTMSDNDPPVIVSSDFGNATTGDMFVVSAEIQDNILAVHASIEMETGGATITQNLTLMAGSWITEVAIPSNLSGTIRFRLIAEDLSHNIIMGPWTEMAVIDDDSPVIVSSGGFGSLEPTTGDQYRIKVKATDNVQVDRVYLTLSSKDNRSMTFNATLIGMDFELDVTFWTNVVGSVSAVLFATDAYGNMVDRSFDLIVRDNDPPVVSFKDLPTTVGQSTGCVFEVEALDNIGIGTLTVRSILGSRSTDLIIQDGECTFSPGSPGFYLIEARAIDRAGNVRKVEVSVNVTDDIPPHVSIDQVIGAKAGGTVKLSTGSGETGATYTWEITSPSGKVITLTGKDVEFEPSETGTYKVKLKATDPSGNEAVTESSFKVDDGPAGVWIFILSGIALIILLFVAVIAFLFVKRRKVDEE